MEIQKVIENFEKHGFSVKYFETKEDAAKYLNEQIDNTTVAAGGSVSIAEMGLAESLGAHNTFISHAALPAGFTPAMAMGAAMKTEVYLTSVNGASETGELVNIDGRGNRVASTFFGHNRVYFVVGINKFEPDLEKAIHRARNVSAPKNAKRLGRKTPCAVKGDRCYDCSSPERICNGLVVHWRKLSSCAQEILIINEPLGY